MKGALGDVSVKYMEKYLIDNAEKHFEATTVRRVG
jgi:hypothetical protein